MRQQSTAFCAFVAFALLCRMPAAATPLTMDEVFGATPPWGPQPSHIVWSPDDSSFLYVQTSQDASAVLPVWQYELRAQRARILIDPRRYGTGATTPANAIWSPDGKRVAFVERAALYVRDVASGFERRVDTRVEDPQWSPKSDAIAYVRRADLYVAKLAGTATIQRLTRGGVTDTILNGGLDWVYPEELDTRHGFAWSPDAKTIAYMRMDERRVTNYPIVDFLPGNNAVSYERYPLAGQRNPGVSLHAVSPGSGDRVLYDASARDEYLPFFDFAPDGSLIAEVLDRSQRSLRMMSWKNGSWRLLYAQSDPKWIDDVPLPVWTNGHGSLWVLDRDGSSGLYLRDGRGSLTRLTGAYHVFALLGTDPVPMSLTSPPLIRIGAIVPSSQFPSTAAACNA